MKKLKKAWAVIIVENVLQLLMKQMFPNDLHCQFNYYSKNSIDQNLEPNSSGVKVSLKPDDSRLANDWEDVTDPYTCNIMSFVLYEDVLAGDEAVWIPCPCGRWFHEDCTEGCLLDKGKDH